jgi:hypothetical protein
MKKIMPFERMKKLENLREKQKETILTRFEKKIKN